MTLQAAKSMLVRDRMDYRKPHLTWFPDQIYRYFSERNK